MRPLTLSLLALLPCLSAEGQETGHAATGPSDPAELESFIDGAMAALMESHEVPGATISVVKDGEVFFAKGCGYAGVDRNRHSYETMEKSTLLAF
jgi:CubicO group peptidase (beta-lactamase class C family)